MDAAILFSDILIVPFGLGMEIDFVEGRGPVLDALKDSKSLSKLTQKNNWSRIQATYETVSKARESLRPDKALIGFAGAPWTVATYMIEGGTSRDHSKAKEWAYAQPNNFKTLIEILVESTIEHLSKQIDAGADVVMLFDSWAGALAPGQFDKWVISPTKEICRRVRNIHPKIKIIGFPRGAGAGYIKYSKETEIDAVGLDTSVSPIWAAAELEAPLVIQGNLDPVLLVAGGKGLQAATLKILDAFDRRPFIFNLGHGILPSTPPEHVAELSEFLGAYRKGG
tara:strand:- start:892 stop:1737 length:846 start_codon:yes stop_codon:yes gene_type:complete